jgi:hypothetical protein
MTEDHDQVIRQAVFPGISIIGGAPDALAPVQALRATVFVDSLPDTQARLAD